ncbi:SRPBCC family protein [Nocardia sp. CNY236]|uniref:SRPBCC family protein n=1 Tax=Nocardia sp. CNY236 TaxID=1169152 RepID=UPI0004167ECE|nr:SRPBCC family protein [Nocardia sp. CNY236]
MAHVAITVPASPEQIFAVLADGWLFSTWVVGATHVRDVDDSWPAVGSRLHFQVGVWPFTMDDTAEVVMAKPPRRLEWEARVRPVGSALIRVGLWEMDSGKTHVHIYEHAVHGVGAVIPTRVQELLLVPYNKEALSRLADIAVGRARAPVDHGRDGGTHV